MNDEIKEILDYISSRTVDDILLPDYFEKVEDYITNLQQELEKARLENKVLKEQMVAMVQPTYTYGIRGGSSE